MIIDDLIKRYKEEKIWHKKVALMDVCHLMLVTKDARWNQTKTAQLFDVSIGLVSENLKLAKAIYLNKKLVNCADRETALKKVNKNG